MLHNNNIIFLKVKVMVNVNETNDTRNCPHKIIFLFDCSFMLNLSLINYYLSFQGTK